MPPLKDSRGRQLKDTREYTPSGEILGGAWLKDTREIPTHLKHIEGRRWMKGTRVCSVIGD